MAEQTTKQFLTSKEGRPVLIGCLIALTVFPLIGYNAYQSLYGSEEPSRDAASQEQRRARAGSSQVDAVKADIRPDLTSQNLSQEARETLDLYNQKASEEGRMGQPTPDDVVLIDVNENTNPDGLPVGEDGRIIVGYDENGNPVYRDEAKGRTIIGYTDAGKPIFGAANGREIIGYTKDGDPIYADPNARPANLNSRDRRQQERANQSRMENIRAEHEEYRNRRFQAAVEMVNFEGTPPSPAGMAFAGASGPGSDLPSPARIETSNSGQSRLVREGEEGGSGDEMCEHPLVRGGEIRYAQTDIALDTDFQGPVRMTFLEGNLRGYTGMGTFELNELGAKMKLKIDTLFDPDGQNYQVSGWVLDPNTTLWAMSSEVDRHIIYRYGGFGLGVVLGAFKTLAENRATISQTVTPDGTVSEQTRDPDGKQVTWTVLGEFGELFEEAFRENLNRPITVRLHPDEEAGVLFENTVCELNTKTSKERRAMERRKSKGFGDPLG